MSTANTPALVTSLHRPLDSALIGSRQEEEHGPAARPVPVPAQAKPLETCSGIDLSEIVRANLHAAAQHATLGHAGPSFRECSRPSCRNASNLIPYPVELEPVTTEADLEEIFENVVPAALEKAASSPSPFFLVPEGQDKPALVA